MPVPSPAVLGRLINLKPGGGLDVDKMGFKGSPGVSMTTLLLAGVTLGIMCSAFILLFRYIAEPHILVSMDRWTMGRLDVVGFRGLAALWRRRVGTGKDPDPGHDTHRSQCD